MKFIYLIILLMLVPVLAYAAPDEYVWAGGEKGARQVPVYYVDTIYCKAFNMHDVGCYDIEYDYITIKIGYRDVWTPRGCTVLQHEQTHAWGFYDEVSVGALFQCDNPNDNSETDGEYDADNFFHPNPRYVWQGYDKLPLNYRDYYDWNTSGTVLIHDPRCTTWYVGEKPDNCGEQERR